MKYKLTRAVFLSLLAFGGLTHIPAKAADAPRRPLAATREVWSRTELYFGTNKADGTVVSEADFNHFVNDEITPRFPDGLTLLTGNGQFRNSQGTIVKEKALVLILFFPPQTLDADKKVQEIRERYKDRFAQESVLRVDSFAVISF